MARAPRIDVTGRACSLRLVDLAPLFGPSSERVVRATSGSLADRVRPLVAGDSSGAWTFEVDDGRTVGLVVARDGDGPLPDASPAEVIAWFADQPGVGVVAASLGAIADGRSFMLAADRCALRRVPLVVQLACDPDPDAVTAAVFRQLRVTGAAGVDELAATISALASAEAGAAPRHSSAFSRPVVHWSEESGEADALFAAPAPRGAAVGDDAVRRLLDIYGIALGAGPAGGGFECGVGIHRDPVFGPAIVLTSGEATSYRVPPFNRDEARRLVREVGAPVRGRARVDVDALADMVVRVQRIAVDNADRLGELRIEPVVVGPRGAVALGARAATV